MIHIYYRNDRRIVSRPLMENDTIPKDVIWVDVRSPDEKDLDVIEKQLGVQIPTKREIWKNHVLNRLYIEDGIAYMTAALITKVESPYPGTSAVTFILAPGYLLTVHEIDPTSFRNFSGRIERPSDAFPTACHLLEGLLEEIITRVAYNSEIVVETLDDISHGIFGEEEVKSNVAVENKSTSQMMKAVLRRLGAAADLNSKINESLHSINRMLVFFKQVVCNYPDVDANIDILVTDAAALTTQTAFLSDKITFQLDALLGMINVEQNLIIKIFSVVAVFFLPPTLVSSIYGMNFHFMPELEMHIGYPFALTLMLVSAIIPFLYFRKKGWL